jgi:hypothetical protein
LPYCWFYENINWFLSFLGSARSELLKWVRSKIPEYDIKNFANDWRSGKAICALAEAVEPGQMKLPQVKKTQTKQKICFCWILISEAFWKICFVFLVLFLFALFLICFVCFAQDFSNDPLRDCTMGMQNAEKNMQIPMILYPEDMTSDADELSTMTYISYFRDYEEKRGQRNQDDKIRRTPVADQCRAYGPGLEGKINRSCCCGFLFLQKVARLLFLESLLLRLAMLVERLFRWADFLSLPRASILPAKTFPSRSRYHSREGKRIEN